MLSILTLTVEERAMLAHLLRDAAQFLDDADLTNAARRLCAFGKSFYSLVAVRADAFGLDLNKILRVKLEGSLADTIRQLFRESK